MTDESESREQGIARTLRQLSADHQQGRISLAAYRRLRRELLDKAARGEDILPLLRREAPARARPGVVVWIVVAALVLLLAMVAWLLR